VWSIAVLVPMAAFGLALIYVKLQFGSIPVSFLVEPIRAGLSAEFVGIDVSVGDAVLHRSPSGGIELRIRGLGLASRGDNTGIEADEALVELDPRALLSRRFAASRVVLIGPRFDLVQDNTGQRALRSALMPEVGSPNRETATSTAMGAGQHGSAVPNAKDMRGDGNLQRIAVARGLADAVRHMRRSSEASSHLQSFGVRNALVDLEIGGARATWGIPEMDIALDHRQKRSVISASGRIAIDDRPFTVKFRLEESQKEHSLKLVTDFDGLRLPALARSLPQLGILEALDAGVAGKGEIELTSQGELVGGQFEVTLGEGHIRTGGPGGPVLGVKSGKIDVTYDGQTRRLELAAGGVTLEDGTWLRLRGEMVPIVQSVEQGEAANGWLLDLTAIDGAILSSRDRPGVPIERLETKARFWPTLGASELVALSFKAGDAEIEASGAIAGGAKGGSTLDGRIGPISIEALGALWPSTLAPGFRTATLQALVKGRLKGGVFRLTRSAGSAGGAAAVPSRSQLALSLEAEDIGVSALEGLPPVQAPRVLLAVADNRAELTVPDAALVVSPARTLSIKGASVVVTGLDQARPQAEITGRGQSSLAMLVELASRDTMGLLKAGQVPPGTDGKVDAQWRLTVPIGERVGLADLGIEGRVRVTEGRIPNVIGTQDITGAAVTIGASGQTIDVKGDLLLAGVAAKVAGQWMLGESYDRQPPIVISARLDNADRRQLGLDIDDLVQGSVPVEVQVWPSDGEPGKIQVSADLTAAELMLDGLAWRKPPGRAARLAFDVVRPRGSKMLDLQSFKLAGDSIAIDGSVLIGANGKAQSFRFPGFSLNVVSNLEVDGVRRGDRLWELKVRGKTFDGSELMRSLYAVQRKPRVKHTGSLDLDARIDTVLGVNDTTVRQVRLRMRRQEDDIVSLDLAGTMDGGQLVQAKLETVKGQPRVVHASTNDSGQALKTIGFYSSMLGGKGDLWVDLDGHGAADSTGRIQVSRFKILGDPIVNELVQGTDDSRPAIATGTQRPARRVVREEIAFDSLRGSFATGNGQVVIENLTAAGPLIGASVRGRMDFRNDALSIGGTYVPLSGLNRALAGIPLFGELLTGPKGDGIFGITFAVDGTMHKPNVIINPLSIVAPGVLREIFQMVPHNPQVIPRAQPPRTVRGGETTTTVPQVHDGWSSQATPSRGQR
jgi:hypothetical protein